MNQDDRLREEMICLASNLAGIVPVADTLGSGPVGASKDKQNQNTAVRGLVLLPLLI